jgi:hypothetical protein
MRVLDNRRRHSPSKKALHILRNAIRELKAAPGLLLRCERAWRASYENGPPSRRRRFGQVSP